MSTLWVDRRWTGHHGIARYSNEVLARLDVGTTPLRAWSKNPLSAGSLIDPGRLLISPTDLIYSPGFNSGATFARQLLTVHDLIHFEVPRESSRTKRAYLNHVVRPAIRRAGRVVTVSNSSAKLVSAWSGLEPRAVINCGNGIASEFGRSAPGDYPRFDSFLYVGNGKPHKNPAVVFEALALRPQHRLVVITGDSTWVKILAEKYGVVDRVSTRSSVSDSTLADLYRSAHGLLFPSTHEGFGLPVAEALATGGRVAYWSGCSPVAEVANGGGYPVESATSAVQWAAAMDSLVRGDGTGPRDDLIQMHDWDRVGEQVQNVLEDFSQETS